MHWATHSSAKLRRRNTAKGEGGERGSGLSFKVKDDTSVDAPFGDRLPVWAVPADQRSSLAVRRPPSGHTATCKYCLHSSGEKPRFTRERARARTSEGWKTVI